MSNQRWYPSILACCPARCPYTESRSNNNRYGSVRYLDPTHCRQPQALIVAFNVVVPQLEEEAHLLGGTWHALCDDAETTINADKYSSNEFYCWLVVDPYVTPTPKPMDDEEFIEIERGVSMQRCMSMLGRGELSIVSSFVVLMGARKLRQLGLLEE